MVDTEIPLTFRDPYTFAMSAHTALTDPDACSGKAGSGTKPATSNHLADGNDFNIIPLFKTESFNPALTREFLDLLEDSGSKYGQTAQSFDLTKVIGVVVILPPAFSKPGLEIRPYHPIRTLDHARFTFRLPYGLNKSPASELADTAFVIEIRDLNKFTSNISDNARYANMVHMLEDLCERLYG